MKEFDENNPQSFQDDEEFKDEEYKTAFGDDNSPDGRRWFDQDSVFPWEIASESG